MVILKCQGDNSMFKKGIIMMASLLAFTGTAAAAFTSVGIYTSTATAVIGDLDTGTMTITLGRINGATADTSVPVSSITWSGVTSTVTWKAADIVLLVTCTYRHTGWAIRVYTDNTEEGAVPAVPRWNTVAKPTTSYSCDGLLAYDAPSLTSTEKLTMCWRITNNTTNTYTIRQSSDTSGYFLYDETMGPSYRCFHYVADKVTFGTNGQTTGTESIIWQGGIGIHHASGNEWLALSNNLNYVYIGANFTNVISNRTYQTTKFKVELYYE